MYEYDRGLRVRELRDAGTIVQHAAASATGLRLDDPESVSTRATWPSASPRNVRQRARQELLHRRLDAPALHVLPLDPAAEVDDVRDLVARDRRRGVQHRFDADDGGARQARRHRDSAQLRYDAAQHHGDCSRARARSSASSARCSACAVALVISWQLGNFVSLLQGWFGVDLLSAEVYYLERFADAGAAARGACRLGAGARARGRRNVLSRVERRAPTAGRGVAI